MLDNLSSGNNVKNLNFCFSKKADLEIKNEAEDSQENYTAQSENEEEKTGLSKERMSCSG